jgi:hypothetical protein
MFNITYVNMKILISYFLGIFLISIIFPNNIPAQEKYRKEVTISGEKVQKSRGEDLNIKIDRDESDNPVPAPPYKRGALSQGEWCQIEFDNGTGYSIDAYVDGSWKGALPAWSGTRVTTPTGYKKIYCKTTGNTYSWKASGSCDSLYYFKLIVK